MRLSIIAAFILPLAALAAPAPAPTQLFDARAQFTTGIFVTSAGVNATLGLLNEKSSLPIREAVRQTVFDQVNKALFKLVIGVDAASKVEGAIEKKQPPKDADQAVAIANTLELRKDLITIKNEINTKNNDASDALRESITVAVFGVNLMADAGLEFLRLQGKNVKNLLEGEELTVPAGFEDL